MDRVGEFGAALLIAYPATDTIASAIDLRREPTRTVRTLQAINLLTSAAATLLVTLLARRGATDAMNAFGGWAIIAGAIQLSVALRRRRRVGGQWPMIISGAGSLFAGITFLDWTGSQAAALHALEQYSIGGGIWRRCPSRPRTGAVGWGSPLATLRTASPLPSNPRSYRVTGTL